MLLDAILTVLRETLEAGVLISLLASVTRQLRLRTTWLYISLPIGIGGALIYSLNLGAISSAFDGVGQELLNALLEYLIYASLVAIVVLLKDWRATRTNALHACMATIMVLALSREGAEILMFFSSYLRTEAALVRALTSGFVGFGVGLSAGVVTFLMLVTLPTAPALRIQSVLLSIISAGMALQATQLLAQADWVEPGLPIWDSTLLLAEDSMLGQMAYAVLGYEATPSGLELGAAGIALAIILLLRFRSGKKP
jgi:high-affinity iron transporter